MKNPKIEILNPRAPVGRFQHVLFDFDGTLSTIREGWERVMVPMMVEMITAGRGDRKGTITAKVERYVEESTGLQTILQMEWLAETVARLHGHDKALTPQRYKDIYNERLLQIVHRRLDRLKSGAVTRQDLMIAGVEDLVRALAMHDLELYVASGTDVEHVKREATALGVSRYFGGNIFGALRSYQEYSKAKVIRKILDSHGLQGPELLIVGDGPVEIREGKARGAVTIGVASDEVRRRGLNPHKRQRLVQAGADVIIPDFTVAEDLLALLFPKRP